MEIREEQPEKALALIDTLPDEITEVRPVSSLNASFAIEVTMYVAELYQKLAGITTEFSASPATLSPLTRAV